MAILRVLRDNSRRTLNEIGVEVGLSATACWTRIKRLETEGVIKRYTIDMDRAKLLYGDAGERNPFKDVRVRRAVRDRKSTRLNSNHSSPSRMPSSA